MHPLATLTKCSERLRKDTKLIFLDSNIPMYIVGEDHPNRTMSVAIIQKLTIDRIPMYSDVEVLQEILHRYVSIDRKHQIQPAFDYLLAITEEVFPIQLDDLIEAKRTTLEHQGISARDAVHLSVMRRNGIRAILSFDRGFDAIPDIKRLHSL